MTHRCHATGCAREVDPSLLMCLSHWRLVPKPLQRAVWLNYRKGQEEDKATLPGIPRRGRCRDQGGGTSGIWREAVVTPEEIAAELRALADRIDGGLEAYVPVYETAAGDPERLRWEARIRAWKKGRFWNVMWGPAPDQPGCWAPSMLVAEK